MTSIQERDQLMPAPVVQIAGEGNEQACGDDPSDVPANALNADVNGLLLAAHRADVDAVGRYVLCRRRKARDPEERERPWHVVGQRQREGDAAERHQHRELHRQDEKLLRPEHLDDRRPERLDDPRQVHRAGVQGDLGVRNAEVLVHDRRDHGDRDHGRAHREVERRHPEERMRSPHRLLDDGGGRGCGSLLGHGQNSEQPCVQLPHRPVERRKASRKRGRPRREPALRDRSAIPGIAVGQSAARRCPQN